MTEYNLPGWALINVDLAKTDADELAALIDDVIDDHKSLVFYDTNESKEPRAVCVPFSRYARLVGHLYKPQAEIERQSAQETAKSEGLE